MNSIPLSLRLAVAQIRRQPGRAWITWIGVMASTCAVVWVVSGYDGLLSQLDDNAHEYLGRYDVLMVPSGNSEAGQAVDAATMESLRQDPQVWEMNPVGQSRVSVTRGDDRRDPSASGSSIDLLVGSRPPVHGAPPLDPILVATAAANPPFSLVAGSWLAKESEAAAAVISERAARKLDVAVGDELLITSLANQLRLPIVGIVEQPDETPSLGEENAGPAPRSKSGTEARSGLGAQAKSPDGAATARLRLPQSFISGIAVNAVYVRPSVAERINGFRFQPTVIQLALRDGVTVDAFRTSWQSRLSEHQPPLRLIDFAAIRRGLEDNRSISSQQSQSWAVMGMASLAAVIIIFSTLSMGVSERAREFALLRAVALTRGQIAGVVAWECVLLAAVGWTGGLLAGWGFVRMGSRLAPGIFDADAALGSMSIVFTAATVGMATLAAAVVPAWRAMRVEPLDAMSTRIDVAVDDRRAWSCGMIGMMVAAVPPLIVFVVPMTDQWRTWCYTFVTYPLLFGGMLLLTPLAVMASEQVLGSVSERVFRLDPRMMKSQRSGNAGRTMGTTLALSLGLCLFVSTHVWGYSMLQPFLPGRWLPDALVAFHPIGLDGAGEAMVREVDGVQQVMPLAVEQARFDWGGDAPQRLRFDNAVLFGVDPAAAFGAADPFLDAEFVEGDRHSVAKALALGGACVVSEDFHLRTGIAVGDEVSFRPPSAEHEKVTWRVVGVVSLPGWHWITKFSGVRRNQVRTATMMFASRQDVRRDFHLSRTEFFWLDLDDPSSVDRVDSKLQQIAARDAGATFVGAGVGEMVAHRPFARMTTTETVRRAISLRASQMIWGLSYLPLITVGILSLAVASTVLASVRARTWQLGVMRTIGLTRSQLVRCVAIEAVTMGFAACWLSLPIGAIAGWCGVGMAKYGGWFAGPPQFLVPWWQLAFGFGLTLTICLIAALWPAVAVGRAEPLALLRMGRGAR